MDTGKRRVPSKHDPDTPRKRILVLDDGSGLMDDLVRRLTEEHFTVRVCFSPTHVLTEMEIEDTNLLIAAGTFPEMTALQCAEKAYKIRSVPSYVILDTAGDGTQSRALHHPGILGLYYRPLKVDKLLDRVVQFLTG